MKTRLDQMMAGRGMVRSRSQAESYVKLGKVRVDGQIVTKPGFLVHEDAALELTAQEQYVSRAALKLASVAEALKLDFQDKTVLDVGSSTGGFTDYALRHGAAKVIAVEVGTDQLHPSLRGHPRIELYEQTDIRDVRRTQTQRTHTHSQAQNRGQRHAYGHGRGKANVRLSAVPDIVVADVSFISLREILPHVAAELSGPATRIVAMVKPQFEAGQGVSSAPRGDAGQSGHDAVGQSTCGAARQPAGHTSSRLKHKGVIKNDSMRRNILKDFESWARQRFVIIDKADSAVSGAKGNQERFYLLRKL